LTLGAQSLGIVGAGLAGLACVEPTVEAQRRGQRVRVERSCGRNLLFVRADRRSRFMPFGVVSDERYHLVDGNEGKPIGNLYFAGEHTNSFYDWQGFMEGACLSGIDAANALLD